VKSLSLAFLLAASAASAQRLVPDPAFARLPGPTLRIADSLRIDTQKLKIEPPLYPFAAAKGGLILYAQWSSVWGFDSLGRRQWSKGWNRDNDNGNRKDRPEVGEVTAVGWDANGTWVSDAAWGQVALLDQYGNVTKSIELPDWVRPSFSNRKTFPVFDAMRVYARYADGSMLVIPRGSMSITGATGYDPDMNYLLKINEDGIIQRTIAKFPSNTLRRKDAQGKEFLFQNPLNQSAVRVSFDGMRTVVFTLDTSDVKSDMIVLRALNDRGDTVWTQKVAYPSLHYTDTQVDSIARARWGNDTEYRERRMKFMPRRAGAVQEFVMDVDKSVWLTLRGNGSTRSVIGFDASGKPIGKFLLPNRRAVRAANMGALWIGEYRYEQRGDLVRYRMVVNR
jgi:hypothetical protein